VNADAAGVILGVSIALVIALRACWELIRGAARSWKPSAPNQARPWYVKVYEIGRR
jgi:hypothetical protein